MRVLVACEYSGTVRDAFIAQGHEAMSCDLLSTDKPNWTYDPFTRIRTHHPEHGSHHKGSVLDILDHGWDLLIAFPPCTHLAVSGARWFAAKRADGRQQQGVDFFMALANANIPKIAIENPIGIMSTQWRKPDQIIQPYHHGHEATKSTCLWLKGLPLLKPTNTVGKGERHITKSGRSLPKWYNLPPSEDRWKIRSTTFQGIADAMAQQWGGEK
jgi:hypothetical protein|tara:strand:- start:643 stop:1284 length:642 start_codon:yes stop_codon:yes gene_type:complete